LEMVKTGADETVVLTEAPLVAAVSLLSML
jgi:hypothetical protein